MCLQVSRVLSIGGRYICVTLAQEHVISLAVEHFVHMGWAVRLHCIQEERGTEEEDSFALPVFVLVCIKFRQPLATPILELCIGDSGAPVRQEQVCELLSAVREHQAYSVLRKRLRTSFNPSANLSLTLCQANSGLPRYTLTVQDSPPGGKIPRSNQFAIFIGELIIFYNNEVLPFGLVLYLLKVLGFQFLEAVRQLGSTAHLRAEDSLLPAPTSGDWSSLQCTEIRSTQTCKQSKQSCHQW